MDKLSVLVPTFNNEQTIRRCLDSVKWADEIVVIDSQSTDATQAMCSASGARVIVQPFLGFARQKNFGIGQCAYDWILQMDSDEYLEAGVEQEIRQVLQEPAQTVVAYQLARKNHVLGKWVKGAGLYPDYQTRLFQKTAGQFKEREVHERLSVSGQVLTLSGHILHEGMPRISKQLANLDRYTQSEANELHKQGKKFHWHQLFVRPVGVFAYRYFWQGGIWEGYRGLILTVYQAFYSFLTYAKMWELEELNAREPR